MENTYLISVEECCNHYNVELTFIDSLEEHGLIKPAIVEDKKYIHNDHLHEFERLVNLYFDLDINLEGIEVVTRLLSRIETMQREIKLLKNLVRS